MRGYRVWAEINFNAISANIETFRKRLPQNVQVMAVVKADAYGHGAVPVAHHVSKNGVDFLGVGDSSEALQLRNGGVTSDILILGAIIEEEIPDVIDNDICVSIHSKDLLSTLNRTARRKGKLLRVHLKIDTGMSRLGISPRNAPALAREIQNYGNLRLEGVFSHLACANSGNYDFSKKQLETFKNALSQIQSSGIQVPVVHFCNSAGSLLLRDGHFDMVRTGIGIYGIDPGIFEMMGAPLFQAMSLKTQTIYIRSIPPGTPVGYESSFTAKEHMRVALCPIGYNDGFSWQLSNKASVLIRGKRAPVIGNVSMDYIIVDVSKIPETQIHDEVTIIGVDGEEAITATELARLCGTIPYEITCRIGKRVKRLYKEDKLVHIRKVGTEQLPGWA